MLPRVARQLTTGPTGLSDEQDPESLDGYRHHREGRANRSGRAPPLRRLGGGHRLGGHPGTAARLGCGDENPYPVESL